MAWIHVIEINVDDFTGSAVYETHHFLIITKAHPVFYLFIYFLFLKLLHYCLELGEGVTIQKLVV